MVSSIELEKQLKLASSDKEKLDLLIALASHHKDDDFIDGWRYGQEALELASSLRAKESECRAHEVIAGCLWKLADYSKAMEHYETALDGFLGLADYYRMSKCYCGIGIIHGINENHQKAIENFDEGLACAKKANKAEMAATITGNIGHIYFKMGRYDDAMGCYEYSLNHHKNDGSEEGVANMLSGMAGIHVFKGEYDKGLELERRAVEICRAADYQRGIAVGFMNIGEALRRMNKLEDAKDSLKKALNYSRSINLTMLEADVLKKLSEVCGELGEDEEASTYLKRYIATEQEEKKEALKRRTEQTDKFLRVKQAIKQ